MTNQVGESKGNQVNWFMLLGLLSLLIGGLIALLLMAWQPVAIGGTTFIALAVVDAATGRARGR